MTNALAIHYASDSDEAFADSLIGLDADLVTIHLVPSVFAPAGADLEHRLAELIARAERATGAAAIGIIAAEAAVPSGSHDLVLRAPALAAA